MKVEEYRKILIDDLKIAASLNSSTEEDEFLLYSTAILSNGEEFDDFIECKFKGVNSRNWAIQIDGYAKDETDGSYCIFITDYHGDDSDDAVLSEDITNSFKKVRRFVEEAIKNELYHSISVNLQAKEFARDLYYDIDTITKFRFYLLTDAYNRQRNKTIKDEQINGKTVELNVWDINRLYDLVCSKAQKESVEILLSEGIPCVKAVEYSDVIADIEKPTYVEDDEEDNTKPYNVISYSSYLAVVPGRLLNDLYLEYGSKLLEGNVRSFLSVKGKVNKSIQNTIKNYPEMFFAYNNGIAATATELDTVLADKGLMITRIKDLQIVNGGQTTASIANTVLTMRRDETVDLDKIFVPMKISVLERSMSEKIIPKISEYSNSQNKVDASDFFSNHPFHIRIEDLSRKTPVPSLGGNQFQQYWFYERTRGQYNQGKMKFKAKSSQLKQYSDRYPEKQVITMLDLAKYVEIYKGRPDVVSKGKQKTLQLFAGEIKTAWDKTNTGYNALYYKKIVALAIIYKKTDEIIKQTDWYREKHSYKANVIAYAMSILFNYVRKRHKGYSVDFLRIWNNQDIYKELEDQLRVLCGEVYRFITGPRETENVTEWCKKELCWIKAQSQVWTINDPFIYSLVSKESASSDDKEEKNKQKLSNEMDMLKEIIAKGSSYWQKVLDWGRTRKILTEKEDSLLRLTVNMNSTGRIPTDKQAAAILQTRKRLIQEGMPMQF